MSSLPALYTVADCYLADLEKLQDLDLDEQTIKDTMEGMIGTVEVKATNVAAFVKNLDSLADQIKQAEAQMATRRKAIENRADAVREYLLSNMLRTGINKIESPYFKIAVCKNPVSVVIDDAGAVPDEFKHFPPPPEATPDRKLIKAAIENGEDVAGAHLEQKMRVSIK